MLESPLPKPCTLCMVLALSPSIQNTLLQSSGDIRHGLSEAKPGIKN